MKHLAVALILSLMPFNALADEHTIAEELQTICSSNREQQLDILDSVMEKIAVFGLTEDSNLKADIDSNLLKASKKLISLTKKIYANKLSIDVCLRETQSVIKLLDQANISKNSTNDGLTIKG